MIEPMLLKGSLGLGDAIYLYPVVKHFMYRGKDVEIVTRYPEIYSTLGCRTTLAIDFDLNPRPYLDCSCSARTKEEGTNAYADTLIMAGIKERPPLTFEYDGSPRKYPTDKKVCVIRNITVPTGGEEDARCMIPDIQAFRNIVEAYREHVYFVTIGWQKGVALTLDADMDISCTDSLMEYIGAIDGADIILTQPGHCVPMAEALGKKLFVIFAAAGLVAKHKRYQYTTPKKILTSEKSRWAIDDQQPGEYIANFGDLLFGGAK